MTEKEMKLNKPLGKNQHTNQTKDVSQTQQQRPESPKVTPTWHASKYKVYIYINSTRGPSSQIVGNRFLGSMESMRSYILICSRPECKKRIILDSSTFSAERTEGGGGRVGAGVVGWSEGGRVS